MASAPSSYTATALGDDDPQLDIDSLFINDESEDDDLSLDGLEENDANPPPPYYTGPLCVVSSSLQWIFECHNSPFRSAAKDLVIQDVEKAIPLVVSPVLPALNHPLLKGVLATVVVGLHLVAVVLLLAGHGEQLDRPSLLIRTLRLQL